MYVHKSATLINLKLKTKRSFNYKNKMKWLLPCAYISTDFYKLAITYGHLYTTQTIGSLYKFLLNGLPFEQNENCQYLTICTGMIEYHN